MLTHVVMYKLRERDQASLAAARGQLELLPGSIPSLRAMEIGTDILHSGRSYDLVIIARFDDLAGLEFYQAHPVHLPVLGYLRDACESIIAVDYEV
jgi:hypothetical protein